MTTPGTPTTDPDGTTAPEASASAAAHAGPRYWPAPKAGKDDSAVVAANVVREAREREDLTHSRLSEAEWRLDKIRQRAEELAQVERLASVSVAMRAAEVPGPAFLYESARTRRRRVLTALWLIVGILAIAALFGIRIDRGISTEVAVHPYAVLLFVVAVGIAAATLIATLFLRPIPLPDLNPAPEHRDAPAAD